MSSLPVTVRKRLTLAFLGVVAFGQMDSKEYENTSSNKKNMLVKSCLFTVTDTNTKLRLSVYSC